MNYLAVTFLIGFLILVHELGHFLAARWTGIPVARFSIGFGPKLWAYRGAVTEYWLSAIPLGGYVLPQVEDEHAYFAIPLRRRIAFCLGGPLANLVLAIPLFMIINVMAGNVSAYAILVAPVIQTGHALVHVLAAIPALFTHADQLSSILGIVVQGKDFVGADLTRGVQFAILMSTNLAVFNLLPIPALDGGKLLLHLCEAIYPKATRVFVPLSVLGLVLLVALIAYATVLDISRYVI